LFRRAAEASAKKPIVLAAGRLWDEAKNVAALNRVADRLPWPVCVAGEDRHPNGADTQLRGVRALGVLAPAELAAWLARASIYALPARYEPFGLSALEAAFAGCALVLGDVPSLREVWGDAAAFVPPDDHAGLRRAIQLLIDDPKRRAEMARRAGERAARYTPQRMADGYLAVYRELIAERGTARDVEVHAVQPV
jgi:glycosyltransferase involved in cell wall biosynthesis